MTNILSSLSENELDMRTAKSSAAVVIIVYAVLEFYGYPSAGFLFGGVWSAANFILWRVFYATAFNSKDSGKTVWFAGALLLKFPVLYGGAFLALKYLKIDFIGLLAGFLIPFFVVFLKLICIVFGIGAQKKEKDSFAFLK